MVTVKGFAGEAASATVAADRRKATDSRFRLRYIFLSAILVVEADAYFTERTKKWPNDDGQLPSSRGWSNIS